jgi:protein-tyrosine phosphatase
LRVENIGLTLRATDIHGKFVDLEWEQRRRLLQGAQTNEPDQQSRWARCGGDEVMNRNRYANVDPYSNNRVKLQVPEGHSDYINASPIVLESTKSRRVTKFIATQVGTPH